MRRVWQLVAVAAGVAGLAAGTRPAPSTGLASIAEPGGAWPQASAVAPLPPLARQTRARASGVRAEAARFTGGDVSLVSRPHAGAVAARRPLRPLAVARLPEHAEERAELVRLAESDPVGGPGDALVRDAVDRAVLALAGDAGGQAVLVRLLARPESARTAPVCLALWMSGARGRGLPPGVVPQLQRLAVHGVEPATRRCAALALGRASPEALVALPRGTPEVDADVANALPPLCAAGEPQAVATAESLARYGAGEAARATAGRALSAVPPVAAQ